jgi:hypothetical protein
VIRARLEALYDKGVVIPKRNAFRDGWLLIMALFFFVCVLGIGVVPVVLLMSAATSTPDLGGLALLASMLFVVLVTLGVVVWDLVGVERLRLEPGILSVRREVMGLGYARRWAVSGIQRFSARPWSLADRREAAWGIGNGKIVLNTDGKDQTIGIGLTDEEAEILAEEFERWRLQSTLRGHVTSQQES